MDVIIFESPTKKTTVWNLMKAGKIPTMQILATVWHFMEITWSKRWKTISLGIDLKKLEPHYTITSDKKKVVKEIEAAIEKADKVYIASDPDWEWMVIGKHLYDLFPKYHDKFYRILFEEISPDIINSALKLAVHDKDIDWNPAKAGIWRAIFDRVAWWGLSTWLRKSFYGTSYLKDWISFWRVQTPALRTIYDRELDIEWHSKKFYSTLHSIYKFWKWNWNKNKDQLLKEDVIKIYDTIKNINLGTVDDYKEGVKKRSPYAPFESVTVLRNAYTVLWFSAKRTNDLLKFWYDNWITSYPRVDTIIFPNEKIEEIRNFISSNYSSDYCPKSARIYTDKIKSQWWHAAVWPVYIDLTPTKLLDENERKKRNINVKELEKDFIDLYDLIWKRSVASQMNDAEYTTQSLSVDIWSEKFRSNSQQVSFDWFLTLYNFEEEEDEDNEIWKKLPSFSKWDKIDVQKIDMEDHETKPPSRYNESSLIKRLKELWIWRPSTYAAISSKLIERKFVKAAGKWKQFTLEDKWRALIELVLKDEKMTEMIDYGFTAKVEKFLDELASWSEPFSKINTILNTIYMSMDSCWVEFDDEGFVENKGASNLWKASSKKNEGEMLDIICPICWKDTDCKIRRKEIVSKKNGKTYVIRECSSRTYNPETKATDWCTYSEFEASSEPKKETVFAEGECPLCKGKLIEWTTKNGKKFKKCENSKWDFAAKKPTGCTHIEWVNW